MRILGIFFLAAFASAQTPEPAILGGPCAPEPGEDVVRIRAWHGFVTKALQAERKGDYAAAADAARDVVRHRCSNEHWWLKLAELETQAGRDQEAVAVLEEAYDRRFNELVRRLADPESPLSRLQESTVFQRSEVAAALAVDRRTLEERRREARQRLETLPREKRPQYWIARDACPGECCAYGPWRAREEVQLWSSPGSYTLVTRVAAGDDVEAVTGEVQLRPIPALVRFDPQDGFPANEGDLVFLLDYKGEGHGRISANGKLVDGHVLSVHEHCPFPSADCWAEVVNPDDAGRQRDAAWWVRIRTRDGLVGYTDEADKFER